MDTSLPMTKQLYESDMSYIPDAVLPIVKGPQNVISRAFPSSSSSNSSINFAILNANDVISGALYLQAKFNFRMTTAAATSGGKSAIVNGYGNTWSLAPFPLSQMFSQCTLQLNNSAFQMDYLNGLAPFLKMNEKVLAQFAQTAPVRLDTVSKYADVPATSNLNVLGGYQTSVSKYDAPSNGSFYGVKLVDVSGAGGYQYTDVEVETTEPILFGPLCVLHQERPLKNITVINAVFPIDGTWAQRVVRCNPSLAPTLTNLTIGTNDVSMLLKQAGLNASQLARVPPTQVSKFQNLVYNSLYVGNLTTANLTQTSQNYQLQGIPSMMIIGARRRAAQRNNEPDFFVPVKNISCVFGAKSGILSTSTQSQLYNMSNKNIGYSLNYLDFIGKAYINNGTTSSVINTAGAPLFIAPGNGDFPLDDDQASGLMEAINFSFTITLDADYITRYGGTISDVEIFTVMFFPNLFVSMPGGASETPAGYATRAEIARISNDERPVGAIADVVPMMTGGSIWSLFGKAVQMLPKALPVIKGVAQAIDHPVANKTADVLGKMGFGASGGLARRVR
jgi:hypothetical protein